MHCAELRGPSPQSDATHADKRRTEAKKSETEERIAENAKWRMRMRDANPFRAKVTSRAKNKPLIWLIFCASSLAASNVKTRRAPLLPFLAVHCSRLVYANPNAFRKVQRR